MTNQDERLLFLDKLLLLLLWSEIKCQPPRILKFLDNLALGGGLSSKLIGIHLDLKSIALSDSIGLVQEISTLVSDKVQTSLQALLIQPEDLDRAVGHTASHDIPGLRDGDTVELAVRVHQVDASNRRQLFLHQFDLLPKFTIYVLLEIFVEFGQMLSLGKQVDEPSLLARFVGICRLVLSFEVAIFFGLLRLFLSLGPELFQATQF